MMLEIGAALFGVLFVYGVLVEPRRLQHVRLQLTPPNMPDALDGFTFHIVSDLHSRKYGSLERKVVKILNAEPASAVFYLGDFIIRNSSPKHALKALCQIQSRFGTFAVLGNAEHKRFVNAGKVANEVKTSGIHLLMNETIELEYNNCCLEIVGVDDPHRKYDDLTAALKSDEAERPFRILLAHSPVIVLNPNISKVDLVLSGHTHGGVMRIPGVCPIFGHNILEYKLSAGLYPPEQLQSITKQQNSPMLYVSKGAGTGTSYTRVFSRPEVTTVVLKAKHS